MVQPSSQLLGSGFGHNGSTSYIGAVTLEPCASASRCRTAWPMPSAMMVAASTAANMNVRCCSSLIIVASPTHGSIAGEPHGLLSLAAIIAKRRALVRAIGLPLT
jgi:hypothetical protein